MTAFEHDIDFKIESFNWLLEMCGRRSVRRMQRLVARLGPEETARRIIHPRMPDEMREVYLAGIGYIAELSPQSG